MNFRQIGLFEVDKHKNMIHLNGVINKLRFRETQ
jgi:hypothetical protein